MPRPVVYGNGADKRLGSETSLPMPNLFKLKTQNSYAIALLCYCWLDCHIIEFQCIISILKGYSSFRSVAHTEVILESDNFIKTNACNSKMIWCILIL